MIVQIGFTYYPADLHRLDVALEQPQTLPCNLARHQTADELQFIFRLLTPVHHLPAIRIVGAYLNVAL